MEQRAIDLINKTKENFKEQDSEQIEKYIASYSMANPKSLEVLENHNIKIKKPSQAIVLTIDPTELERELKLAEEMGFIAAYQQNPRHITQPIEMVIKRMSKADAVGVTYKNEKGIYASFIFSNRAFNYIMSQNNISMEDTVSPELETDLSLIKEDALHVLEAFDMSDKASEIYSRIDTLANSGLGEKEMLFEALKILGGDKGLLLSKIDEVLLQNEEMKRGRAA